ncbi:hypothetical protein ACFX2I_010923 [Malus domestica]
MLIIMSSPPKNLLITYLIFLLLLLGMASMGSCRRVLKEVRVDEFRRSVQGMLPRGPVPPSGPSPCHNKLSPFRHTELSYNHDDYRRPLTSILRERCRQFVAISAVRSADGPDSREMWVDACPPRDRRETLKSKISTKMWADTCSLPIKIC